MELLKVVTSGFKLCVDNFTISFVPTGNKTVADKEFELKERQSDWECGFECANFTVLAAMRTTISKEIYEQLCAPARL